MGYILILIKKIQIDAMCLKDRGSLDRISLDRNCLFSVDQKFHFQLIEFFVAFHLIKTFNIAFDQMPKKLSDDKI
jgi:hypothetical protein